MPSSPQPLCETLGPSGRGHQHQHPTRSCGHDRVGHHGEHQIDEVGRRWEPDDRRRPTIRLRPQPCGPTTRRGVVCVRFAAGCSGAACQRRRQVADHRRRRGGVEEERRRSGPAPRGPLGQTDQRRRRAPAEPRLQRDHLDHRGCVSAVVDHPAADGAPVERHPDARARDDVVGRPPGRHGVVEGPCQRRDFGAHADGASGTSRVPALVTGGPSGEPATRQSPSAARRSSTRGVASQVNSLSERPKWP